MKKEFIQYVQIPLKQTLLDQIDSHYNKNTNYRTRTAFLVDFIAKYIPIECKNIQESQELEKQTKLEIEKSDFDNEVKRIKDQMDDLFTNMKEYKVNKSIISQQAFGNCIHADEERNQRLRLIIQEHLDKLFPKSQA